MAESKFNEWLEKHLLGFFADNVIIKEFFESKRDGQSIKKLIEEAYNTDILDELEYLLDKCQVTEDTCDKCLTSTYVFKDDDKSVLVHPCRYCDCWKCQGWGGKSEPCSNCGV